MRPVGSRALAVSVVVLPLTLLGACGPNEAKKQAALAAFCAAPAPLPWAPDAKTVMVYTRENTPGVTSPIWQGLTSDYYVPAERATRGVPGRVGCLVIYYDVLETRTYRAASGNLEKFNRTRAHTTLRVYEPRTGRLLAEQRATGPEPVPFEGRFSDIVRYRGAVDLASTQKTLRDVVR